MEVRAVSLLWSTLAIQVIWLMPSKTKPRTPTIDSSGQPPSHMSNMDFHALRTGSEVRQGTPAISMPGSRSPQATSEASDPWPPRRSHGRRIPVRQRLGGPPWTTLVTRDRPRRPSASDPLLSDHWIIHGTSRTLRMDNLRFATVNPPLKPGRPGSRPGRDRQREGAFARGADRRGGHFLVGKVSFRVRRPVPRRTTMSELVSRVWS